MSLLICIPAFNEEGIIGDLVTRCKKFTNSIVVCDDGSLDNTANEAKQSGAYVIKHTKNKGKGAALKSLFEYAKISDADVIVTIDGDGQFLPEEIEKLETTLIENNSDIVIGYRFDDNNQIPAYRKVGNKFLDKMTNLASDLPFRDTQSGFRAYSQKAIKQITFSSDGFAADAEILVSASQIGLSISEAKVSVIYDTGRKTSTKNPVSHTGEVITSLLELISIKHPLKFLGIPGLVFIFIGIGFSINVISIFNDTRYFSLPSTLVAIGTLVIGLIFLLMSIILFSINQNNKTQK